MDDDVRTSFATRRQYQRFRCRQARFNRYIEIRGRLLDWGIQNNRDFVNAVTDRAIRRDLGIAEDRDTVIRMIGHAYQYAEMYAQFEDVILPSEAPLPTDNRGRERLLLLSSHHWWNQSSTSATDPYRWTPPDRRQRERQTMWLPMGYNVERFPNDGFMSTTYLAGPSVLDMVVQQWVEERDGEGTFLRFLKRHRVWNELLSPEKPSARYAVMNDLTLQGFPTNQSVVEYVRARRQGRDAPPPSRGGLVTTFVLLNDSIDAPGCRTDPGLQTVSTLTMSPAWWNDSLARQASKTMKAHNKGLREWLPYAIRDGRIPAGRRRADDDLNRALAAVRDGAAPAAEAIHDAAKDHRNALVADGLPYSQDARRAYLKNASARKRRQEGRAN